jgi:hypothetical protein
MRLVSSELLSRAQPSNAESTRCSASDVLAGSAFARMASHRPRTTDSRLSSWFPPATLARNSLICAERAVHQLSSGVKMKFTATNSPAAARVSTTKKS